MQMEKQLNFECRQIALRARAGFVLAFLAPFAFYIHNQLTPG